MIISASREFIFIHLEKCGGTSIESAIEPHLHWSDIIFGSTEFGESIQSIYFKRYGVDAAKDTMLWKHSPAQKIYEFLGPDTWGQFKKISVVRKPEDLIISLYNFSYTVVKYHMGRINRGMWIEKLRTNDYPQQFPFTEQYLIAYIKSAIDGSGIDGFVENLFATDDPEMYCQFNRLTVSGRYDIDFLVDFSDLKNKWKEICLSINIDQSVSLPHLNSSEKISSELSHRSIKKIKKHFAIDYDMLPRYTGTTWQ